MAAADEHVVAPPRDVYDVIGDEAVTARDQVEDAFALADAGTAAKQQAHTEDVSERTVDRRTGRESVVKKWLEAPIELGGLELGADNGDAAVARQLHQFTRRLLPLRDDDAGQLMGQERVDRLAAPLVVQRGEIGDLRLTKNVDSVGADEPRRITRELGHLLDQLPRVGPQVLVELGMTGGNGDTHDFNPPRFVRQSSAVDARGSHAPPRPTRALPQNCAPRVPAARPGHDPTPAPPCDPRAPASLHVERDTP